MIHRTVLTTKGWRHHRVVPTIGAAEVAPFRRIPLPLLLFVVISLSGGDAQAQDDCSAALPCTKDGWFCNFDFGSSGFCEACTIVDQPDQCSNLGLPDAGAQDCAASCDVGECSASLTCPGDKFCNFYFGSSGFCEACNIFDHSDQCSDLGLPDAGARDCAASCGEAPHEGKCSASLPCPDDKFCNFDFGSSGFCEACNLVDHPDQCYDLGLPDAGARDCDMSCEASFHKCSAASLSCPDEDKFCNLDNGYCEECVWHPHECFFNLSLTDAAAANCAASCDTQCSEEYISNTTVDGIDYDDVWALTGSPSLSDTGRLVTCSGGSCADAFDSVCLFQRGGGIFFWQLVQACESEGGIAAIIYNDEPGAFLGNLAGMETTIPSVSMSLEDGEYLLKNEVGAMVTVSTFFAGEDCIRGCSELHPCPDGSFCNYDFDDHGYCEECAPQDEYNCFFSGLPQGGAQDCGLVCNQQALVFDDCKFCPSDVSTTNFGLADGGDRCVFCPQDDMQYPDRELSLFGPGIDCFLVDEFFTNYEVDAKSNNCQLAQTMNYICGCTGPGYAGANTETKQAVLAWLPRVMAIISFMGSTYIIVSVMLQKKRRRKTSNLLLVALSIFDLFGSAGYAFTTLPLPADDYIYGSKGNKATCKTQGFFIQLGTTSAFINVSLAVYYLLVIKYSMTEREVKKRRVLLLLCPMAVGLGLAFVGLPFYDNLILWCNNAAEYWPDIPVAVAILSATAIMSAVCWHVYQREKASKKWKRKGKEGAQRGRRGKNSLSSKVFWQSFWYLMAFYLTWPPYLALQYLWASGRAYSMYGFVLFAGTLVPLQGFWNFVVYTRPRVLRGEGHIASLISSAKQRTASIFRSSTTKRSPTRHSSSSTTVQQQQQSSVTQKTSMGENSSSSVIETSSAVAKRNPTSLNSVTQASVVETEVKINDVVQKMMVAAT